MSVNELRRCGTLLRDRNSAFPNCGQIQAHGWGQRQVLMHSYTSYILFTILCKGHSGSQPELCLSRCRTLAELPDFSGLLPSSWAEWIGPLPGLQGWAVSMRHSEPGLQCDSAKASAEPRELWIVGEAPWDHLAQPPNLQRWKMGVLTQGSGGCCWSSWVGLGSRSLLSGLQFTVLISWSKSRSVTGLYWLSALCKACFVFWFTVDCFRDTRRCFWFAEYTWIV